LFRSCEVYSLNHVRVQAITSRKKPEFATVKDPADNQLSYKVQFLYASDLQGCGEVFLDFLIRAPAFSFSVLNGWKVSTLALR